MAAQDRIVITVMGRDRPGVIARVTGLLNEYGVNILDFTQTIMKGMFAMMVLVDINDAMVDVTSLQNRLAELGEEMGIRIMAQHENVFKYMHRV